MDHQASYSPFGPSWPTFLLLVVMLCAAVVCIWRLLRPRAAAPERMRQAHDLIQALDQYCDWVEAQRDVVFLADESALADAPISRARAIKHAHFPELSRAMVELLMAHGALVDFFWTQQVLRMKEPQAWQQAAAERDSAYRQLRDRMLEAVRKVAEGCRDLVGDVPMPAALTGPMQPAA